jgi:hypothetical protein
MKKSRSSRASGGSAKVFHKRGGVGSGMKEMHHSPGGTMKGLKADHHPKRMKVKQQDPTI